MYEFRSRVRFSETDHDGKLSLISVIDYLQDCCTFQSEDIDAGIAMLEERRSAWMLAGWQIAVDRYPVLCENITVATWPYAFKNFYGERNIVIYGEDGDMAVYANSIWIFVDLDTGKPVKVPEDIMERYVLEPKLDMDYAPRKIKINGEAEVCEPTKVYKHQIDANVGAGAGHMNNSCYVLVAKELLPENVVIRQVRVDYRKAAVLDDVMIPRLYKGDNMYTVQLGGEDGDTFAIVEFRTEDGE